MSTINDSNILTCSWKFPEKDSPHRQNKSTTYSIKEDQTRSRSPYINHIEKTEKSNKRKIDSHEEQHENSAKLQEKSKIEKTHNKVDNKFLEFEEDNLILVDEKFKDYQDLSRSDNCGTEYTKLIKLNESDSFEINSQEVKQVCDSALVERTTNVCCGVNNNAVSSDTINVNISAVCDVKINDNDVNCGGGPLLDGNENVESTHEDKRILNRFFEGHSQSLKLKFFKGDSCRETLKKVFFSKRPSSLPDVNKSKVKSDSISRTFRRENSVRRNLCRLKKLGDSDLFNFKAFGEGAPVVETVVSNRLNDEINKLKENVNAPADNGENLRKNRNSFHQDVDEALSSLLWQPYEYQNPECSSSSSYSSCTSLSSGDDLDVSNNRISERLSFEKTTDLHLFGAVVNNLPSNRLAGYGRGDCLSRDHSFLCDASLVQAGISLEECTASCVTPYALFTQFDSQTRDSLPPCDGREFSALDMRANKSQESPCGDTSVNSKRNTPVTQQNAVYRAPPQSEQSKQLQQLVDSPQHRGSNLSKANVVGLPTNHSRHSSTPSTSTHSRTQSGNGLIFPNSQTNANTPQNNAFRFNASVNQERNINCANIVSILNHQRHSSQIPGNAAQINHFRSASAPKTLAAPQKTQESSSKQQKTLRNAAQKQNDKGKNEPSSYKQQQQQPFNHKQLILKSPEHRHVNQSKEQDGKQLRSSGFDAQKQTNRTSDGSMAGVHHQTSNQQVLMDFYKQGKPQQTLAQNLQHFTAQQGNSNQPLQASQKQNICQQNVQNFQQQNVKHKTSGQSHQQLQQQPQQVNQQLNARQQSSTQNYQQSNLQQQQKYMQQKVSQQQNFGNIDQDQKSQQQTLLQFKLQQQQLIQQQLQQEQRKHQQNLEQLKSQQRNLQQQHLQQQFNHEQKRHQNNLEQLKVQQLNLQQNLQQQRSVEQLKYQQLNAQHNANNHNTQQHSNNSQQQPNLLQDKKQFQTGVVHQNYQRQPGQHSGNQHNIQDQSSNNQHLLKDKNQLQNSAQQQSQANQLGHQIMLVESTNQSNEDKSLQQNGNQRNMANVEQRNPQNIQDIVAKQCSSNASQSLFDQQKSQMLKTGNHQLQYNLQPHNYSTTTSNNPPNHQNFMQNSPKHQQNFVQQKTNEQQEITASNHQNSVSTQQTHGQFLSPSRQTHLIFKEDQSTSSLLLSPNSPIAKINGQKVIKSNDVTKLPVRTNQSSTSSPAKVQEVSRIPMLSSKHKTSNGTTKLSPLRTAQNSTINQFNSTNDNNANNTNFSSKNYGFSQNQNNAEGNIQSASTNLFGKEKLMFDITAKPNASACTSENKQATPNKDNNTNKFNGNISNTFFASPIQIDDQTNTSENSKVTPSTNSVVVNSAENTFEVSQISVQQNNDADSITKNLDNFMQNTSLNNGEHLNNNTTTLNAFGNNIMHSQVAGNQQNMLVPSNVGSSQNIPIAFENEQISPVNAKLENTNEERGFLNESKTNANYNGTNTKTHSLDITENNQVYVNVPNKSFSNIGTFQSTQDNNTNNLLVFSYTDGNQMRSHQNLPVLHQNGGSNNNGTSNNGIQPTFNSASNFANQIHLNQETFSTNIRSGNGTIQNNQISSNNSNATLENNNLNIVPPGSTQNVIINSGNPVCYAGSTAVNTFQNQGLQSTNSPQNMPFEISSPNKLQQPDIMQNISSVNVNYYRAVPVNVVSSVPTIPCVTSDSASIQRSFDSPNANGSAVTSNNYNISTGDKTYNSEGKNVCNVTIQNNNNNDVLPGINNGGSTPGVVTRAHSVLSVNNVQLIQNNDLDKVQNLVQFVSTQNLTSVGTNNNGGNHENNLLESSLFAGGVNQGTSVQSSTESIPNNSTTFTEVIVHNVDVSSTNEVVPLVPQLVSNASIMPLQDSRQLSSVEVRTRTFQSTEAQTEETSSSPSGVTSPETTVTSAATASREQRRRERRERRHQRRLNSSNHRHSTTSDSGTQFNGGQSDRLPDILNSHLPPPYSPVTGAHAPIVSPPMNPLVPPMVPTGPMVQTIVPANIVPSGVVGTQMVPFPAPVVPGQVPLMQPGGPVPVPLPPPSGFRFPFPAATGFRRGRYSEEPPKSCCGLLAWKPGSLRWFIAMIALVAVCCVLVGTALGAMRPAGRDHLTVSLLMIGVGVVLVTVSGIAWRLTSHDSPTCRSMLGLGSTESVDVCSRRFVPRLPPSYGRPHHPYAAMMYPEFQYRPPPPSYQASMQEYRLRLLLLDRGNTPQIQAGVQNAVSPPPTYRSHAGSLLRAPLSSRREANQSEYSCPPSYRSQNSSTRPPTLTLPNNSVIHSREQSLSLSESNHGSSVVNVVNILNSADDDIALDNITLDSLKMEPDSELNPLKMLFKGSSHDLETSKEGNLVTIVQTSDESPVIVTVSGSSHAELGNNVQISEIPSEMEILAHL